MDQYKKASREYLIALLTSIKKVRREMQEQQSLADKWEHRTELARTAGRTDLLEESEKHLREVLAARQRLKDEEERLMGELREAQTRYDIESAVPERNVDPDLLLDHLTDIAGQPDSLQEESSRISVDAELEELKRKMGKKP